MKRIAVIVLMLCLILSGCTSANPADTTQAQTDQSQTTQAQTKPSDTTSAPDTTEAPSQLTLMDSAEKIGQIGNLSYIPNAEIENMAPQEMQVFGNGLLLWSNVFGNDGCCAVLKLISLENGDLLGEKSFPSSGYVTIQTCGDRIGICDSGLGKVYILDGKLNETAAYTPGASEDNWFLSADLKTLYQINWQKCVSARDLDGGTTVTVIDNAKNIFVGNQTEDYLVLSYTDLGSQRTVRRILDLHTGSLEPLPMEAYILSAKHSDNVWLLQDGVQWGTYYILADGVLKTVVWQENRFDLLLPQCHLLAVKENGLGMSVYGTDGSFISKCEVPEGQALYVGSSIVWSELWGGYFMLGMQEDQSGKLMFWDIKAAVSGESLLLENETEQGGSSAEAYLYERAKEIGDRFGVKILIADQCGLEYNLFSAYAANDTKFITQALDIMETALSKYPTGYFEQLKYGDVYTINFELIGGLHPNDNSVYEGSYAGITMNRTDRFIVALDIYLLVEQNVYHEIAHITDARLAFDAEMRDDALFSEESWNKLLPAGFTYAGTYLDISGSNIWQYVNSGYFVNDYACRFATEDRATMFEMAMINNTYIYSKNPGLKKKLEYYAACIRDCFDTTGWPDTAPWETVLS